MNPEMFLCKGKDSETQEWVEGYYGVKGKDTDIEQHCIMVDTLNTQGTTNYFYFSDINIDPKTLCRYTGKQCIKGNKVFENDLLFSEIEEDEGDVRIYCIVKWIHEWSRFVTLLYGEWLGYVDNGISFLNEIDQGDFCLDVEQLHYAGSYFDKPELFD